MTAEIRAFEFALGLFSVLIGLAVADVATSFHRLIRHPGFIRWDPLALLAALYALLMSVGMWFDLWGIRGVASTRQFFFYVVMVLQLFLLFLISAASLPDDPAETPDLRAYYEHNRRYFWTLVAMFQVLYASLGAYFMGSYIRRESPAVSASFLVVWALLVLLPLALRVVRARWLQYATLIALFAVNLWHYAPYAIN
jgi:high-affinity K+ transport system ATPase subunit B